jgi:hypothetical protein
MLLESLRAAIRPPPPLATIGAKAADLTRHLREPRRKRTCQAVDVKS